MNCSCSYCLPQTKPARNPRKISLRKGITYKTKAMLARAILDKDWELIRETYHSLEVNSVKAVLAKAIIDKDWEFVKEAYYQTRKIIENSYQAMAMLARAIIGKDWELAHAAYYRMENNLAKATFARAILEEDWDLANDAYYQIRITFP